MHYVHISTLYRWTTLMFIGFWKRCFVLVHSEVCCGSVRFLEYAANSAGEERLRREGETSRFHSTEWNLRFIQNVASGYVLCLTKESVITATLVHAPVCVCVCVCVCAPRTPHGGPSALEISSGGGSGLYSLPVRIRTGVRTLRSPALEYRVPVVFIFVSMGPGKL